MKKALFVLLLLVPTVTMAAKPIPNPSDYTITVHVLSSHMTDEVAPTGPPLGSQHLVAVIGSKTFDLLSVHTDFDLLRVGDYKAKIVRDEKPNAYEYYRIYEFLFPDGKTHQYHVVGEE